jgi:hypothetical protein
MTGIERGHCCGKLLFARTVRLAAALAHGLAIVGRGLARGALASRSALPNPRIIAIAAAIAATPAVAANTSATPAAAATTSTATTSTATPSAAAASTTSAAAAASPAAASTVAASATAATATTTTATTTTSATTASFGRSGVFVDGVDGEERQAERDSGKAQHQERNAQRADHSFAAGPHGFLIMGNGHGDKSGKGLTSVTAKCCRSAVTKSPVTTLFCGI